ncbi:hypothetical protein P12x_001433 [Tundrisphaera lichenicola]|uniref:hypothetical protein n=1 Tax=Tundrisphaera lichenicola TaxID=2029860 RepID=UPI003EC04733
MGVEPKWDDHADFAASTRQAQIDDPVKVIADDRRGEIGQSASEAADHPAGVFGDGLMASPRLAG